MKKAKGFTLVELLAVIIILSLLSLLAGTVVTKLVKDSKEDLYDTQIELIKSSAEAWGAENMLYLPSSGECGYLNYSYLSKEGFIDSNITNPITNEKISDDLKIKITNNVNSDGNLIYNYEADSDNVDGCYNLKKYKLGEIIYYDVSEGKACSEEKYKESYDETVKDYINSNSLYNGIDNKTGNQNSCLKFYVISDNITTLSLLLDHNTAQYKKWNWQGPNQGPYQVLEQLKETTKDWKGTLTPKNYKLSQTYRTYEIDYSDYKARLITAEEVANITSNKNWDSNKSTANFYFDTNLETPSDSCKLNSTNGCKYGWLYDRTSIVCKRYGCLNNSSNVGYSGYGGGYWTATSNALNSSDAWAVDSDGKLVSGNVAHGADPYGVRPVIEVVKTNLN